MKIKALPSILAAIILPFMLLLVSSCDKKEENNDKPTLRISQLTYESTFDAYVIIDTVNFKYNSENQLVYRLSNDSENSTVIQYNQDGTISQVRHKVDNQPDRVVNYEWSGNMVTGIDSWFSDFKNVYEFNAEGKIKRCDIYHHFFHEWLMDSYVIFIWQDGNLISTETWHAEIGIGQKTEFIKSSIVEYTYDKFINPYMMYPSFAFDVEGWEINSKNNLLSKTYSNFEDNGFPKTVLEEYSYTYNNLNYPLSKIKEDPRQSVKVFFQYE